MGLHGRRFDHRYLGTKRAPLSLFRYLATDHQHWNHHRDPPDGLSHPKYPKPRLKLDTKRVKADEVIASAVVIDSGTKFSLRPSGNNALTTGQVFTVISNTSASPIVGTFHNLRDGAILTVNGSNLQASYTGGDGNDLTLTVVP